MNEENSKAKLVRDYGKSDSWKAIESQFNTVADEEAVFEAINEEGRSHELVKSELDRVREWYNVMGLLLSMVDRSDVGGQLVAEYVESAMKGVKAASISKILSQDMLLDSAVYTLIDWKRLSIKFRKIALTFLEECAKSHETPVTDDKSLDPYKKAE